MSIFHKLRDISLANVVLSSSDEYVYRRICRDYSKTFHTPLHIVETLPIEHVLKHYFENQFESISSDEEEGEAYLAEMVQKMVDPEGYDDSLDKFMEEALIEQQERLENNGKKRKKNNKIGKKGGVNLSKLDALSQTKNSNENESLDSNVEELPDASLLQDEGDLSKGLADALSFSDDGE